MAIIVESGVIVAAGLLTTFSKCTWKVRMWILSHPLFMDMAVFILLNMLHWGTFSGLMVAATGSLVCSGLLSAGRWYWGYMEGDTYYPGKKNIAHHLLAELNYQRELKKEFAK